MGVEVVVWGEIVGDGFLCGWGFVGLVRFVFGDGSGVFWRCYWVLFFFSFVFLVVLGCGLGVVFWVVLLLWVFFLRVCVFCVYICGGGGLWGLCGGCGWGLWCGVWVGVGLR